MTALAFTIAALTALGFWLEGRFHWARRIGVSLLVIAFGALLSNLGLVPLRSPVYDAITGPVTSLAIVWLLLAVNLRDLRAAGPRMLLAFALAVVATCAGALIAALTVGASMPGHGWKLAGVLTGTYAGGSLNFVAVARAVELEDNLFTATMAADNVLTAVWIGATLLLPQLLRRWYPPRKPAPERPAETKTGPDAAASGTTGLGPVVLEPFDLLALLSLGLGCLLAAEQAASRVPAVPEVLWLTTFALLVAQIPAVQRLRGAFPLGLVALHLFFVVIGIGSRVSEILREGPAIFLFTGVVVLVHAAVTYGGGRLLRLDVETISVASQAAVGGPSTAMALAAGRGWTDLALPGLMVGLLGYAVGTYAGLLIASIVRGFAG